MTVHARPDPLLPAPCRITDVRRETGDTWTFGLDPGPGGFTFAPGQFNMLYVFGAGEIPLSVCGDPQQSERVEHTIRAVGSVSNVLCGMQAGDTVGLRGPYGAGWPMQALRGRDLLFVSGGLGLAPLRPALLHALHNRDDYGRVGLVYGSRNPDRLLYYDEIKQWNARDDTEVRVAVGQAGPDWPFEIGMFTSLIPDLFRCGWDPARTTALICSSEGMMLRMVEELRSAGMADENILLALERNMKCGLGQCGRCQLGGTFVCRDGPVFSFAKVERMLRLEEV